MRVVAEYLSFPREGEAANGDAVVVRHEAGRFFFGVVDALGHGEKAAEVARRAVAALESASIEGGVASVMQGLHAALRTTRGAAVTLGVLAAGRMEGCGVGNVFVRSSTPRLSVVMTPGVVGARVPRLRVFEGPVEGGERLMVFSDGISSQLEMHSLRGLDPKAACSAVMNSLRRPHDDATVLVVDVEAP